MKIAENISWKTLQDKVVAVNVTTGVYFTMNAVSSEIWAAIDQGMGEEDILKMLIKNYPDVDAETLKKDYQEQIDFWKDEELIIV